MVLLSKIRHFPDAVVDEILAMNSQKQEKSTSKRAVFKSHDKSSPRKAISKVHDIPLLPGQVVSKNHE